MNSRRSFFKRLAQAAAIIALAPQIAFRAPQVVIKPELSLDAMFQSMYAIARERGNQNQIDIFCDKLTAERIQEVALRYYKENYA